MNTPQNPMALSGLTGKPMKKPSPCPLPSILHRLAETLRLDSAYPRVLWLSLLVFMAALCADTATAQTLTSGGNYDGTILVNQTNTWSFTAATGDRVVVRIGRLTDTNSFNPWLRIYNPNGVLIGDSGGV